MPQERFPDIHPLDELLPLFEAIRSKKPEGYIASISLFANENGLTQVAVQQVFEQSLLTLNTKQALEICTVLAFCIPILVANVLLFPEEFHTPIRLSMIIVMATWYLHHNTLGYTACLLNIQDEILIEQLKVHTVTPEQIDRFHAFTEQIFKFFFQTNGLDLIQRTYGTNIEVVFAQQPKTAYDIYRPTTQYSLGLTTKGASIRLLNDEIEDQVTIIDLEIEYSIAQLLAQEDLKLIDKLFPVKNGDLQEAPDTRKMNYQMQFRDGHWLIVEQIVIPEKKRAKIIVQLDL